MRDYRINRACLVAAALFFWTHLSGCTGPSAEPRAALQSSVYTAGPATRDGTGKYYLEREIAIPVGHLAAGWLERPERQRMELPRRVIDNLELERDDKVADIGAGTGYFTFRLVSEVPDGRVYAVDISPQMLAILDKRRPVEVNNIETVLGTPVDPKLPASSIDVALIVDAYHEFSHPVEMLSGLSRALRPGGRLVLIEYRAEDPTVPIKPLHKMSERQARLELEAVGFELVENRSFLPQQHFLVFRKASTDV